MAILESVKELASKLGAETNGRDITDQLNIINRHLDSTGSRDIAEAVKKLGEVMPEYEVEYDLLTEEPSDWATNYSDYYVKSEGVYVPVSSSTSENVVSFYKSNSAINSDGSEMGGIPTYDLYKGSIDGGVTYTVNAVSVASDKTISVWEYDSSDNPISELYRAGTEPQVPGSFTTSSNAATIKVQMPNNVTDVSVTTQITPTWEPNTYYKKDNWK